MVVDADFKATDGLGFQETVNRVAVVLKEKGYKTTLAPKPRSGGYIFQHSDGLPDFGLWVMPNNAVDGFIEDFIKISVSSDQKELLKEAVDTVGKLKSPLFSPIHRSKAEVSTWMAWQKVPGQALHGVVGGELVDFTSEEANQLMAWLKNIFK